MARYTGPKSKIARRYGEPIMGPSKALAKKNYPPGVHGKGRRSKKIGVCFTIDGKAESEIYLRYT